MHSVLTVWQIRLLFGRNHVGFSDGPDYSRHFLFRSVFCSPTRLLSIIASFSCTYVSHGSVATQSTCGGTSNNCPQNAPVKEFWKSVYFWRRNRQTNSTWKFLRAADTIWWLTSSYSRPQAIHTVELFNKVRRRQNDTWCEI